jgi:hypothetical protein
MPLGEVPPAQGSLLVAAGSHRLPAFAPLRSGYGRSQARPHAAAACSVAPTAASQATQALTYVT